MNLEISETQIKTFEMIEKLCCMDAQLAFDLMMQDAQDKVVEVLLKLEEESEK